LTKPAVQQDVAIVAHKADVHGTGVHVDPPVKWVLGGGESPEASSFLRDPCFMPTVSIPLRDAEGGGLNHYQGHAGDSVQRPLRSRCPLHLMPDVAMIDIANGCAKRTYKSDFWRKRCVNHHYFLICPQGKS
jgi:hypothetical protein